MRGFWERLSEREKLFVGVGAAIFGLLALFQLIVAPAIGWRSGMSARRENAEELYRLVTAASSAAGVEAASAGVDLATPILNVITKSTGEAGIEVNYRNARGDGAVDANVAAAPGKLFDWLKVLETRYGVSVASADIARSAQGEMVQAQLTLVRRSVS